MSNQLKLLFLILILGIGLRLTALGNIPSGFFRDEAALGYNSYSIWQTGQDEFGMKFPIVFRSFEVFFLPLYEYLSAPIIGLLDLHEFSTRLLSAFAGVGALILIYLICQQLWGNKNISLLATFVLAISPWHIFYSRGAFEGNLALTMFSAGFLFILKFINHQQIRWLFFTVLFFILAMYSYQAERFVVPFFILSLLIFYWKKLWAIKFKLIPLIIFSAVLMLPLLNLTFRAGGYHRALGVTIFSQDRQPPGWEEGQPARFLVNNRPYLLSRQLLALYLSYFSPQNLFFAGDYLRQRAVENYSVFYAILLPCLILGLVLALKKLDLKVKLLLGWAIIAPIPASVTSDPFHTYRSLLLYFPLTVLIAVGLNQIINFSKYRRLIFTGVILILLVDLNLFLFNYSVVNSATRARDWDFGYKEVVNFIQTQTNYTKVVFDDPNTESYIQYLFFAKVNPALYQQTVAKLPPVESYYYSNPNKIRPVQVGNIYFRHVDWASERGDVGTIFVMSADRLQRDKFTGDPKVKLLKEIKYPSGELAFTIVRIINQK
ncbi:MAG: glycosyltransferase family 39 protein [Candidatus Daviesbacteria bacterium]|nr:MAG: glycosyltransferase family 39 protein [Candidatus Daviesbacteria bacterium]